MRSRSRTAALSLACICAALTAVLFSGAASALSIPMPGDGSINKGIEKRQVALLEHQWKLALMGGDAATLGSLLSDSYVGIGPDGTIFNKAEEVDASASGANKFTRLHVEDRKIRIYGTTAVVTSRVTVQGTFNNQPLLGQYRYTRVWALTRGQWHIVSFEANRIGDSSARKEQN